MRTPQHGFFRRARIGVACALLFGLGATNALARQHFSTPDAAMTAFGQAVLNNDEPAMQNMLGEHFRDVIPPVDDAVRAQFIKAWGVAHAIRQSDGRAVIAVGNDGWTLPIPIVKSAGGWQFDTAAGAKEMRLRRIGRNELAAIQVLQAIRDAEDEYAETTHDDGTMMVYASKLSSSPGKHDGLYWPTGPGESPSPLGPAFEGAGAQNEGKDGYYGYRYKILTSQGPGAQGGALNYVLDGKLFAGFAVMAWPARYGDTGVMSFIANYTGQVYQRDLGPNTAAQAAATQSFDPGHGWRKVSP
ncbi:DUF2950 domain-containing protein [Paraburkholderia sacchari]|uniref:DUF2950 domain-containing protein n=1 Tax=Paraburkholderia sacchari TaxID=159450 RepID=A0A8T6ZEX7_9BURK|nr:DUF2950 domain-containing protein [Paraburkholderia sacchari]NLP63083.1 DUF2950 domain-containing protein [Paraburkholderia sacchari]